MELACRYLPGFALRVLITALGRRVAFMKFGITSKLFLAILITSITVALAMGLAVRVSFTQGFLGYLNEQELERAESLLPRLRDAYVEYGSWQFLRDEPRRLFWLFRPRDLALHERQQPDAPPLSDLTGFNLRVAVLDAAGERVVGNPAIGDNPILRPITVADKVVGWLAVIPFQQVTTAADVRFQAQQLAASWTIGALAVLLAAAVAMLLARVFLAPLKRIAHTTQRLAAGDYSSRVQVSSRDELGRLARDFNQLARALERNEQMRRDFMADISHELRTPLAVLRGELEAMEDGIRPLTLAALMSLQGEVATLSKLVDDLYELSLADVGALTYRKTLTDLDQVLQQVVESFAERLDARGITLEREPLGVMPLWMLADVDRMRQLFSNLLENTVRYTDPGGRLRISCRQDSSGLHIMLQDTAPGVPPELLSRLFERFYRVDGSRNRASGGAGLGLAICRNIVEAHDGRITAQSSPLGGVWIDLVFPPVSGGGGV